MKIYFSISFRGDIGVARKIVSALRALGHDVINKSYDDDTPIQFYTWRPERRLEHYRNVFKLIKQADLIVLECTLHSLTIGQMIQESIDLRKPVLILTQPSVNLAFLDGMSSDDNLNLLKIEYTASSLNARLKEGLDYLSNKRDIRFTLLLPPEIVNHLDTISEKGGNRSEYIRNLIYKDMKTRT